MIRPRVWVAAMVGAAAALFLYFARHFFFLHAIIVGLGVAFLTWSIWRTFDRLRDLYRPPE